MLFGQDKDSETYLIKLTLHFHNGSRVIHVLLIFTSPSRHFENGELGWGWSFLVVASVQFSSVAQSCPTLFDPMNRSTPGLPVHHQLPELTLSSPSPPAFSLSQHQGLFQGVSSSHQVAKVLELQLQHQSFQWIFRVDFLYDWLFFLVILIL